MCLYFFYFCFYQPILPIFFESAFLIMTYFWKWHSSLKPSERLPNSVLAAVYMCSIGFSVSLILLGFTREFYSVCILTCYAAVFHIFSVCSSDVLASAHASLLIISISLIAPQCVEVHFAVLQCIAVHYNVIYSSSQHL